MDDNRKKINSTVIFGIIVIILFIIATAMVTYAFFNYTRTGGANTLGTGTVDFDFVDTSSIEIGNAFPINQSEVDNTYESNFTITAHSTLTKGIKYSIYAIPGDTVSDRTRLLDSVTTLQFTSADDGDGFTTMINNYSEAKSPVFVDGRALISTGLVKDTSDLTSKSYKVTLFIDSDKIFVSSTTKRTNNAEGNPSIADTSTGNVTADRYIKNDNNLVSTTLYPANSEQEGKIIYTTNEFSKSYYSIKIVVEANDATSYETVYFDANGGTVNRDTMQVKVGDTYGFLPTPTRDGYSFLRWDEGNLFDLESSSSFTSNVNDWSQQKNDTGFVIDGTTISGVGRGMSLNFGTFPSGTYSVSANIEPSVSSFYLRDTTASNNHTNITISESSSLRLYIVINKKIYTLSNIVLTRRDITSDTVVIQNKDHVLKAIWQKNS